MPEGLLFLLAILNLAHASDVQHLREVVTGQVMGGLPFPRCTFWISLSVASGFEDLALFVVRWLDLRRGLQLSLWSSV